MDLILQEFKNDLTKVRKLLGMLNSLRNFAASQKPQTPGGEFDTRAVLLHDATIVCHADLVVLSGAIVLYLGGRFEFFVRERFEQSCDAIASKCVKFNDLPRVMREKMITMTAEVMADPRKYGHAEKGVEAFIKNLALNIGATSGLTNVNRQCLSITYENMRAGTLKELFERIDAKDIWQAIAEQAAVRTLFVTQQVDGTKSKAIKYLNDFMEVRNKIAHPSGNFSWPDITTVQEHLDYFDILAQAISDVVALHEATVAGSQNAVAAETASVLKPSSDGAGVGNAEGVCATAMIGTIQTCPAEQSDSKTTG